MKLIRGFLVLPLAALLVGCAQPAAYDYSSFRQSAPKSILVIPPEDLTLDSNASHSLLSQVTYPLAEAGYYVFPVAVVEETFQQNGLTNAHDIRNVKAEKLAQIFGADALLDLTIKEYGTKYKVIDSETVVTAEAKLLDLKTGQLLWNGKATASSKEQSSNTGGGHPIGILLSAVVKQIASKITDKGHEIAGITSNRLLAAGRPGGILYGPRSPMHGKEQTQK